ncbi:uncharacterized protein METZ01_LOCUS135452, partial [marine metagenome]
HPLFRARSSPGYSWPSGTTATWPRQLHPWFEKAEYYLPAAMQQDWVTQGSGKKSGEVFDPAVEKLPFHFQQCSPRIFRSPKMNPHTLRCLGCDWT